MQNSQRDDDVTQSDVDTTPTTKVNKPRHRQWGGAFLGLLLGVGGLAAGRLGHLYPHFDVFSQFGLQFVAISISFSLAVFFPRYKGLVGSVLTVTILAVYGAWPHMVSSQLQATYAEIAGERNLRVAHFNTFKNNDDYDAIVGEVLRLDADVVTLIEMNKAKKQAVLFKLSKTYPYSYSCAPGKFCDQAIVSKIPFEAVDGKEIWTGPPYIMVRLGGKFSGVSVYGVHTTRFPHSRAQLTQIRAFTKLIENVPGERIVMGDFNATPFSRVLATLEQGADLDRTTELPTWPAQWQFPQLAIDHIFISKGFRVVGNQQIGNNAGSDHFPILETLALRVRK